MTYDKEINW